MLAAPHVLTLLLILLSYSGWTNGLCNLENGTVARCHELDDVKYIETYDLESLKASPADSVLHPGIFSNLSSLRHLDLSGGDLQKVEPGSFRKLSNLRSLDLADNRIEYLELASLDGLNHLHSLNLRKNNLRQLPPALARLKILRHLDVTGNPLQCNCASLRVRDLIVKRGVKMSKKILCVGPNNMKGTPLMKPDAGIICALEEQDREMQKDQAYEGSGDEGSTDILDQFDDDDGENDEYTEVQPSTEASKEPEVETPYPETEKTSTVSLTETQPKNVESATTSEELPSTTSGTDLSTTSTGDEEEQIFFDDKNERGSTDVSTTEKKDTYKDALFYPVEGSGDEEEGSGEGSGTGMIFTDGKADEETSEKTDGDQSNTSGESFFDILFSVLWSTTAAPEEKKEPDLVGEQFIDVSSTKEAVEEAVVTKKVHVDESALGTTTIKNDLFSPTSGVELLDSNPMNETSKLGKVRVDEDNGELAEVSPARQSKKGMGSYVVLACLLAILATLIGFAAYKGDFCRKRRKRGDVEHGTEMKDMQKALLDTGNAAQPKIASNGNAENVPLVEGTNDHEDSKDPKDRHTVDSSKSPNGTSDYTDPVKPPRRTATPPEERKIDDQTQQGCSSPKEDSQSARTSSIDPVATDLPSNNGPASRLPEPNGPPLSPSAQRVKITLQENPDSVPRTPILITRTMAGENLVKAP